MKKAYGEGGKGFAKLVRLYFAPRFFFGVVSHYTETPHDFIKVEVLNYVIG